MGTGTVRGPANEWSTVSEAADTSPARQTANAITAQRTLVFANLILTPATNSSVRPKAASQFWCIQSSCAIIVTHATDRRSHLSLAEISSSAQVLIRLLKGIECARQGPIPLDLQVNPRQRGGTQKLQGRGLEEKGLDSVSHLPRGGRDSGHANRPYIRDTSIYSLRR